MQSQGPVRPVRFDHVPGGQWGQSAFPSSSLYRPASHVLQADGVTWPSSSRYRPEPQALQKMFESATVFCLLSLNQPMGQMSQAAAAEAEAKYPFGQYVHWPM